MPFCNLFIGRPSYIVITVGFQSKLPNCPSRFALVIRLSRECGCAETKVRLSCLKNEIKKTAP